MNTQNDRREIVSQEVHLKEYWRKCFSWSAVIVGALVGLGISFLLNLFGIAIGLAAFTTGANTTNLTFAIGGFLGLLVASIISMSVLGWVAGYLGALTKLNCSNNIHCNYGCLYGFTAWSLALLVSVLLSVHVGKFISYTVAALANPNIAVESYTYSQNKKYPTTVTHNFNSMDSDNSTATVNLQEAKKTLALTTFAAFVLFFVGAFFASLVGHIGFERCMRKHGHRIE